MSTVFTFISTENCELFLKTDAGSTGWSAVLSNIFVEGFFSSEESNCNINLFELKAVYFGLKFLCKNIRKTLVKILADNTTAIHSINNMGSCRSVSCDNEIIKIWQWPVKRGNFIIAANILSILNKCRIKGGRHKN